MTIWLVWPCVGDVFLENDILLVMDVYPDNVYLVDVRKAGTYHRCGYIQGDGALGVRLGGIRRLRVRSVSAISGCAQAVEACHG